MNMRHGNPAAFAAILFVVLLIADAACWYNVAAFGVMLLPVPRAAFLDVGQGEAELVILPGNVKIMIDAGPDETVLEALEKVLGPDDRSIDVAVISDPDADHFAGFGHVLDHYRVGAFIYNGRNSVAGARAGAWAAFLQKIRAKNIPLITLGKDDRILYEDDEIDVVSPDEGFARSAAPSDTGLVERVKTSSWAAFFAADIGFNEESALVAEYGAGLATDILKTPQQGFAASSGEAFLKAIDPHIAVIEPGEKSSYGRPLQEALAHIVSSTSARVFRTDEDGTIEIWREKGVLKVKEIR